MAASNFNAIFAVDSSPATNQILTDIRLFAPHAYKNGEAIFVNLLSESEMRTFCTRRSMGFQQAVMITRDNSVVDERSIVTTVRNLAVRTPTLKKPPMFQKSTPKQMSDEKHTPQASVGRNQDIESQIREEHTHTPVNAPSNTMTVGEQSTTSPARYPQDAPSATLAFMPSVPIGERLEAYFLNTSTSNADVAPRMKQMK